MSPSPYRVDVLIQGFPGRAVCHGGLGWSTITLLRGNGRTILVDVGAFGVRKPLAKQLRDRDVKPADVTDVVLTHAHYDHAVNFTLFPNATVWIGAIELEWASAQPPGFDPLPELYVRELAVTPRVRRINGGEEFLPGMRAIAAPGHTPGHLLFHVTANPVPLLFTGDAAKNRAELMSDAVDSTEDRMASLATLDDIWAAWRKVPGTLLVPGHDRTMRLDPTGRPVYVGDVEAGIAAWFDEDLEKTTVIALAPRA